MAENAGGMAARIGRQAQAMAPRLEATRFVTALRAASMPRFSFTWRAYFTKRIAKIIALSDTLHVALQTDAGLFRAYEAVHQMLLRECLDMDEFLLRALGIIGPRVPQDHSGRVLRWTFLESVVHLYRGMIRCVECWKTIISMTHPEAEIIQLLLQAPTVPPFAPELRWVRKLLWRRTVLMFAAGFGLAVSFGMVIKCELLLRRGAPQCQVDRHAGLAILWFLQFESTMVPALVLGRRLRQPSRNACPNYVNAEYSAMLQRIRALGIDLLNTTDDAELAVAPLLAHVAVIFATDRPAQGHGGAHRPGQGLADNPPPAMVISPEDAAISGVASAA